MPPSVQWAYIVGSADLEPRCEGRAMHWSEFHSVKAPFLRALVSSFAKWEQ